MVSEKKKLFAIAWNCISLVFHQMCRSVHDETKSIIGDKVFTKLIVKKTEKIVRFMHSGNFVLNTIDLNK